ncbi:MAG: PQQ-binding-like beta-propeller repeat protein [Planctomycetes bacterium]|nr:PQQ-binding-like beta-propeller repeat protein [Planctomycetota bacterium]
MLTDVRWRTFLVVLTLVGAGAVFAGDWPQFGGPGRDNHSDEQGLMKEWPKDGPGIAWRVETAGIGYASVSVAGGRVFTQGIVNEVEQVIALDEKDGHTLWMIAAQPEAKPYKNGQGDGPRGTPTVDGDRVYAESGQGALSCHEVATGKIVWQRSLTKDFGGHVPGWGYSESPLVVGDWLIVTPGGKGGTLAALNKMTGETVWESKGVTQGAQYCSPQLAEIAGVKQIIQMARDSVFAVELATGKFLWEYKHANNGTANVCMPLIKGDYVFASSAYGTGGGLVHVTRDDQTWKVDEVYFEKRMANHHGGLVRVGDYIYGFGSRDLMCMNYMTGAIAWSDHSVGKGSIIAADGMLYLLGERREMALAEATHEAYREHGRFKLEDQNAPTWAHPVVANGRLYLRNEKQITAFDLKPALTERPSGDSRTISGS